MRLITITIIALFFFGCSHSQKLRRAERKINRLALKYPELTTPTQTYVIDTTYLAGFRSDTVSAYTPGDNFVNEQGKIKVTTQISPNCDSILQSIEVEPDSLIKKIPADCPPRVTVNYSVMFWEKFWLIVIGAIAGSVGCFLLVIYLKR
jgi:hypothetical protein